MSDRLRGLLRAGMVVIALLIGPVGMTRAQGDDQCAALYQAGTIAMMTHCFDVPGGTACAAADNVRIELQSGQVLSQAGGKAQLSGVLAVRALPGDGSAWGLARLSVPDPLDERRSATLLLLGPAEVEFAAAPTRSAETAFSLTAPSEPFPCDGLPRPGVLVQSPPNALTLLRVNGIGLAVNGLALLQMGGDVLIVSALTRETILSESGTVIFAGYAARVGAEGVSPVTPYDPAWVAHLPTEVLPTIEVVALPGNALLTVEATLFSRPALEAYTNTVIRAGLPVNVLGRSADGEWLAVRSYDGALGWMPRATLDVRIPGEIPVVEGTPRPPARPFGAVYGYVETNAEHNNLRDGPGQQYAIVATVPFRTGLSLYGRSRDNQWLYVEMADGTRAWINADLISPSTPYPRDELPYVPEGE